MPARNPHTRGLRELATLQKAVSKGRMADARRRELLCQLHQDGVTQVQITAVLNDASEAVGGPPVGLDSVQKIWARYGRNGNGRNH